MKVRVRGKKRTAISPVIAEVALIAITLIAGLAMGGVFFGILGTYTRSAQISVSAVAVPAATASCATTEAAAAQGSCSAGTSCGQLTLINTGTMSAFANAIVISYGGNTYTAPIATAPRVAPQSETLLYITALPGGARPGEMFTGYVATSNGASVPFVGNFQ